MDWKVLITFCVGIGVYLIGLLIYYFIKRRKIKKQFEEEEKQQEQTHEVVEPIKVDDDEKGKTQ